MTRAAVIGCGNMGGALIKGLASSGNHTLTAIDVDREALDAVSAYCDTTTTELAAAADADVVFLAVKPDVAVDLVGDLPLSADQTLVSIAAGVPTSVLSPLTDASVVRVMPNLAAEYGMMAAAVAGSVDDEVRNLLSDAGVFVEVEEAQMDVATAVNGSGPAFVFYLIGALKRAGVGSGLDPEDAEVLAAQTFKGAAETVLRSDRSIEDLVDAVCSPKGTTIEGMEVLWDSDVEETLAAAVAAAERRAVELSQSADDA
jgi:pyrroline-5-carboxylate reductase